MGFLVHTPATHKGDAVALSNALVAFLHSCCLKQKTLVVLQVPAVVKGKRAAAAATTPQVVKKVKLADGKAPASAPAKASSQPSAGSCLVFEGLSGSPSMLPGDMSVSQGSHALLCGEWSVCIGVQEVDISLLSTSALCMHVWVCKQVPTAGVFLNPDALACGP